MSIYGVGSSNVARPPVQRPVRDGARAPGQDPAAATPGSARLISQITQTKAAPRSVPVEPPPGTDPALWSVLSSDERAFFAKAGAMGPLTYGRAFEDQKASQLPASRGGRLDVKV